MKGMEFDSTFESDMPPDSTGLTTPTFTVRIWDNKEIIAELEIGNVDHSNKQYYAQTGKKNGYYAIKKKYLETIPLDLSNFKFK